MAFYEFFFLYSGYLIISPRIFRAGSTQRLTVSLYSVSTPWVVTAKVQYKSGGGDIASDEGQFTSLSGSYLDLQVC